MTWTVTPLGVRVAFLDGTATQRASQLAEMLRDTRHQSPLACVLAHWTDFFYAVVRGRTRALAPSATRAIADGLQGGLVGPIWRRAQKSDIADAARAYAQVLAPALASEVGQILGRTLHPEQFAKDLAKTHVMYDGVNALTGLPLTPKTLGSPLGCSSLVWSSGQAGALIQGRNFDLPSPDVDDAGSDPPLLCIHRPASGLAHISLHHGSGYTPGVTAVNEAGLSVGLHQNFTTAVSVVDTPIIQLATELIETCASLDAAVQLLRQKKTCGGWTFVISHQDRAVAVEIDAKGAAVLPMQQHSLSVVNCYQTYKRRSEFSLSTAWSEHNVTRLHRLQHLAKTPTEQRTAQTMAQILGDHTDDAGQQKAYGNVISAIHNVDSAIFAPNLDRIWVGVGTWPRNSGSGYEGFSISSLFAGHVETVDALQSVVDDNEQKALQAHARATRKIWSGAPLTEVLLHLDDAIQLNPTDPTHRFVAGAWSLCAKDFQRAASLFANIDHEETSAYRRGLAVLMQARTDDLTGKRQQAIQKYKALASETADPTLRKRAKKGISTAFRAAEIPKLAIDAVMADVAN